MYVNRPFDAFMFDLKFCFKAEERWDDESHGTVTDFQIYNFPWILIKVQTCVSKIPTASWLTALAAHFATTLLLKYSKCVNGGTIRGQSLLYIQ